MAFARATCALVMLVFFLCARAQSNNNVGYQVTSVVNEPWGLSATLQLLGNGPYGGDLPVLVADIYFETSYRLHVKIHDPNSTRWEVPDVIKLPEVTTAATQTMYNFSYTTNPFGFAVTRVSNGAVIFNSTSPSSSSSATTFNPMIFEDQYLELSTQLPTDPNIYGLGERVYQLRLTTGNTYTLFNRDQGTPVQKNLYGSHPIYLEMRDGLAHGVFLLNSNAMDVVLNPGALTYKVIGGVLDYYIFLGPTPNEVIQQYTELIGRPFLPPYWGLGWHQCRWGYHTINDTIDMVDSYEKYNIPLDTAWNDIDYMDGYKDFTFDPVRFPPAEMNNFVNWLHSRGQQYIIITDPGISTTTGYPPYDQGMAMDVFVKDWNNQPIEGSVWPGVTVFPDFLNQTGTAPYWYAQISAFHDVAPFDGLWIDMNEISSFCQGSCTNNPDPNGDPYDNPPYVPGGVALNTSTISLRAITNGTVMYNTHNLYAYNEGIATMNALQQIKNERSMVISRASFPGHGYHASHWLGDNDSDWPDLYYSIPGLLNFQLFGIPLVGADICGFNGNTTEQLCARWMQLGSFYPFSRNHNSIGSRSQEPYAFGELLISVSQDALFQRYSLLPYWYTLFYEAHINGSVVARPLFFEFTSDANTLGIDYQYLVGRALLVTPVLVENATSVTAYFPDDGNGWYDPTGVLRPVPSGGGNITIEAPIEVIPWSVRGGNIIPRQTPETTTAATRKNPYQLMVALSQMNGFANGTLYLDDGVSLTTDTTGDFSIIYFEATAMTGYGQLLSSSIADGWTGTEALYIDGIQVFGVSSVSQLIVNGRSNDYYFFNKESQTLDISALQLTLNQPFNVTWVF